MPSPLTVRRATLNDARGIASVHVASWQGAYQGFFPAEVLQNLTIKEREELWRPRLSSGSHLIWVAERDGQVVGFLSACPSRDDDRRPPAFAEFAAVYVHPSAWGAGAGRALSEAAIAHLRQTAAQTVIVWVLVANTAARHFYERLGFIVDDGRKEITLFDVTLPEMRYRLSLR